VGRPYKKAINRPPKKTKIALKKQALSHHKKRGIDPQKNL
jgi:hypothetical protein